MAFKLHQNTHPQIHTHTDALTHIRHAHSQDARACADYAGFNFIKISQPCLNLVVNNCN